MDLKEIMIQAVNLAMKKNEKFKLKYGDSLDLALNYEKCTFLAKSKNIDKPQYGGSFICVARYNKINKKLLWECENPITSKLSKQNSSFIKEIYNKHKEMIWFNAPGVQNIDFKTAHCLVSFAFTISGGLYLTVVEDKEISCFIILKTIDAVREEVNYHGR